MSHRISSFNELEGIFSRFNYWDGVNMHCRALDVGMWGMILHSDVVAGQPTLPD